MNQYLVTTPNPLFEGKTLGVKFARGRALLDASTLDPALGHDVDELAWLMEHDFRYTVKPLNEEAEAVVRARRARKSVEPPVPVLPKETKPNAG